MTQRTVTATLAKRPVATLSRQERASLASCPYDARLVYLLFVRPYADQDRLARVSEQRLLDGMADLHPNGRLSLERVRASLDALVEQGLVSPDYAEQAYRLVVGVH